MPLAWRHALGQIIYHIFVLTEATVYQRRFLGAIASLTNGMLPWIPLFVFQDKLFPHRNLVISLVYLN